MEKVSRIIPSNARIEAVDLSKSKPGRGKLPGIDKEDVRKSERLPGSELSAVDRLAISENAKLLKPDEAHHTDIARRVTEKFFGTYNNKAEPVNELNETPANLNMSNESENAEIEESLVPVKNDLIPEKEKSINNEQVNLSKYA